MANVAPPLPTEFLPSTVNWKLETVIFSHTPNPGPDLSAFIESIPLGKIKIAESGTYTLAVKPIKKVGSHVMNLRSVTLKKTN